MTSAPTPSSPDEAAPGEAVPARPERYRLPAAGGPDGRDDQLGRHVALRRVDAAGAAELEREARFAAQLEHGAIPAVYDFAPCEDGGAILVTRRVAGITLAEAIADARAGTVCPELAGPAPVLHALMRVCDAVQAAHAKGIVHRQLAPACITLAGHGEVLVSGWSGAMQQHERPLTTRYTGERQSGMLHALDDQHVDVRDVGVCLFAALVLRPPTPGAADPFSDVGPAEGARLSPRLCALIRRALRSSKAAGFRGIGELRQAIEQCAADELVEARAPAASRYRQRRPWLAPAAALVLAALALAAWWVHRQLTPAAAAWTLVASENFEDESWRGRWSGAAAWEVRGGKLVSAGKDSARLNLRQRLHVPVAIEYTGRILPGERPGDLSVVWSEGGGGEGTQGQKAPGARTFSIQAACNDNAYFGIFEQPGYRRLAHNPLQLELGREYRFRVEIDGARIAMLVDGRVVLEHLDSFPSTSGYVSLLGWHAGKAFDDVRVYARPLASEVPATAMGDALYSYGHYDDAASLYARLIESGNNEAPVVQQAIFRKGMAERRAQRQGDSNETWSYLTDPRLVETADALRLEDLVRTGQQDLFFERLRTYWRRSTRAHHELRLQWAAAASATAEARIVDRAFAEALLAARNEVFPQDATTGYEAARLLLRLDRNEEVLREFPGERLHCIAALLALGRLDELDKLPYVGPMERTHMRFARGDFQGVIDTAEGDSYWKSYALCKLGRASEITGQGAQHPALLYLGRATDLMQVRPLNGVAYNECLLALDRFAEAAGAPVPDLPGSGNDWRAHALLGQVAEAEAVEGSPIAWLRLIKALEDGDAAAIATVRATVKPPASFNHGWFGGMVIGPFADRLAGRPEALDTALADMTKPGWKQVHGQRAWYFARGALGEADQAEVTAMPAISEGRAWWLAASGLRAEREKRTVDARAAYAAFIALPGHLRLLEGNALSASVECFVRWRHRALGR